MRGKRHHHRAADRMPGRSTRKDASKGVEREPDLQDTPDVDERVWRPECASLLSELCRHTRAEPFLRPGIAPFCCCEMHVLEGFTALTNDRSVFVLGACTSSNHTVLRAVHPEHDDCPDYPQIIKNPMDLGTIQKVFNARKSYANPFLFANDVRLTFNNCIQYNPEGHPLRGDAANLLAFFESRWALSVSGICEAQQHSGGKSERVRKSVESFNPCDRLQPPLERRRRTEPEPGPEPIDPAVLRAERLARRQAGLHASPSQEEGHSEATGRASGGSLHSNGRDRRSLDRPGHRQSGKKHRHSRSKSQHRRFVLQPLPRYACEATAG